MSFLLRNVEPEDLSSLQLLARQFILLNLPDDKTILESKINKSVESFSESIDIEQREYLFVVEDLETQSIVGCSQVIAKHGTEDCPHLYFEVSKKERMSQDLGIGFIHQILSFKEDTDGPTEIGGLVVDSNYRRRPERVGKQISLVRFLYMAMNKDSFRDKVLCELTAPLTSEGRSEFWEALGRRFTGMSYQEADRISQVNKEFIQKLFPNEDIYFSLLDSSARLVMGCVGEKTKPAQILLEKMGFEYLNEVDPFDGGPHYGTDLTEIPLIKNNKVARLGSCNLTTPGNGTEKKDFNKMALVGWQKDGKFRAVYSSIDEGDKNVLDQQLDRLDDENRKIYLPEKMIEGLQVKVGASLSYSVVE